jgi:Mg2+ and Co2+ transporter CorA
MENTLTAIEWLEKEITTFDDSVLDGMMEQYASYRTRELEEKIMQFRKFLQNNMQVFLSPNNEFQQHIISGELLVKFDKHFNITSETNEK